MTSSQMAIALPPWSPRVSLAHDRDARGHDPAAGPQHRFAARQLQAAVEVSLGDVGIDPHVQPGAKAGRDARVLPNDRDATVQSLGLQMIGRVVATHSELAAGTDYDLLVEDDLIQDAARSHDTVVEEDRVADHRSLRDVDPG